MISFALNQSALITVRTLIVFYSTGMALQLWFWAFSSRTHVRKPIVIYAAGWHSVLAVLAAQVLLGDHLPPSVFWRAFYNAAFLGSLTGLAWIIFEGRANWYADKSRIEVVNGDELKAAVQKAMTAVTEGAENAD